MSQHRRRAGFTLVELLVVIIIMLILLASVVGIFGLMFRNAGLRQGGLLVSTAVTAAKTDASRTRKNHFIEFKRNAATNEGIMQIWKDTDPNNPSPGNALNTSADEMVGKPIDLPKGVAFGKDDGDNPGNSSRFPAWIKIASTGYVRYSASYTNMQTNEFENNVASGTPDGDIVLHTLGRTFRLYIDINEVQGSVRKSHFYDN